VQARDVDKLPIVSDTGQVVGTGTPMDTPLPSTPTVVPAPTDNDSAQAPAVNIKFSAAGTRSIQYTSDVSSPAGDTNDWVQFTPFTQSVRLDLTCTGNKLLAVEILQNNQPVQNSPACGTSQILAVNPGSAYLIHIQAAASSELNYTQYILTLSSVY
jgi:hypothetical protein